MRAPTRHRGRSRYPTRSRNAGAASSASSSTFNPLTGWTTDPVHGVWASDPLWVPPADGGAVSSWRNGGSVGGDLVQATGTKQPTYRASTAAFNNQPTVQGDGTDDFLMATVAVIAQPVWVVLVAAHGAVKKTLFDGSSSLQLVYDGGSPRYFLFAGTALDSGDIIDTNPHLHVCTFNGASSGYTLDGVQIASGNAGTNTTNRFTLLSRNNGSDSSSGSIAYAAIFDTDPTALPEWATFKAWVASTYGITVA